MYVDLCVTSVSASEYRRAFHTTAENRFPNKYGKDCVCGTAGEHSLRMIRHDLKADNRVVERRATGDYAFTPSAETVVQG